MSYFIDFTSTISNKTCDSTRVNRITPQNQIIKNFQLQNNNKRAHINPSTRNDFQISPYTYTSFRRVIKSCHPRITVTLVPFVPLGNTSKFPTLTRIHNSISRLTSHPLKSLGKCVKACATYIHTYTRTQTELPCSNDARRFSFYLRHWR